MPETVDDDNYPHRLSARELILALIDSSSSTTLPASYFIAAGALFGMDPGSLRVSLARLVKDGSLSNVGRGLYQRDARDGALHTMVRRWAEVESTLTDWQGGWLGASVAHLSRKNRNRVKSWERAMRLCGFAPYQSGMWLRPANLLTPPEQLRATLVELGFPDTGLLMDIASITPLDTTTLNKLWPVTSLEAGYRDNIERLGNSLERIGISLERIGISLERIGISLERMEDKTNVLKGLDADAAARETLVVGRLVTRDILLDPLLPEQMIDTGLRSQMISAMRRYDQLGRAIWREFYQRHNPVERVITD